MTQDTIIRFSQQNIYLYYQEKASGGSKLVTHTIKWVQLSINSSGNEFNFHDLKWLHFIHLKTQASQVRLQTDNEFSI